ncbi:MAG TPA: DUF262 domain-containing protein [Candidatus Solibacter sp.]|nr:DUF262 domain-containing protein [Candidatus Solibacter sp.]
MALEDEIGDRRKEIATDAYAMSIGELVNLYKDGELDVHPEFQRVYRWNDEQKSALVESVLLGIPVPSVFVAQREDGVWDVVDGVQRLSTLLQLQGELKDDEGNLVPRLVLKGTKFLPSLAHKVWESDDEHSLSSAQRIDIKRAKLDLQIIKRESDSQAKYELFQRLNSLGSQLTPQEIRNCLLVSINRGRYEWMRALSDYEPFRLCASLPDNSEDEQYDMELVLRFLVFRQMSEDRLQSVGNLHQFLTDEVLTLGADEGYDADRHELAFKTTFDLLASALADESFRKYNPTKGRFEGPFLISAFELVGMGLGYRAPDLPEDLAVLRKSVEEVWQSAEFSAGFSTGVRADSRMAKTIPFGRQHFQAI